MLLELASILQLMILRTYDHCKTVSMLLELASILQPGEMQSLAESILGFNAP